MTPWSTVAGSESFPTAAGSSSSTSPLCRSSGSTISPASGSAHRGGHREPVRAGDATAGSTTSSPQRWDGLGPLVALYPGSVRWMWISPGGELRLVFQSGAVLTVAPDPATTAWSVGSVYAEPGGTGPPRGRLTTVPGPTGHRSGADPPVRPEARDGGRRPSCACRPAIRRRSGPPARASGSGRSGRCRWCPGWARCGPAPRSARRSSRTTPRC